MSVISIMIGIPIMTQNSSKPASQTLANVTITPLAGGMVHKQVKKWTATTALQAHNLAKNVAR
jgi:hypothetical protein